MKATTLAFVLSVIITVTLARPAMAEEAEQNENGRWSLAATAHIGPFENYPNGGISVDALYHFGERLRLGGRILYYAPKTYGNVRRESFLADVLLQVLIVNTRWVDWTFDVGVGLGYFHDDYQRVYDDVSRLAPGLALGTGIEIRATSWMRPFLGFRTVAYFTENITDSQWLELTVGLRFVFGTR